MSLIVAVLPFEYILVYLYICVSNANSYIHVKKLIVVNSIVNIYNMVPQLLFKAILFHCTLHFSITLPNNIPNDSHSTAFCLLVCEHSTDSI